VHQTVVAILGCAVGLLAGSWTTHALVGAAPLAIPRLASAVVDLRVAMVTAGLSIVIALVFGLLPALQASRARPAEALRAGGRGVAGGVVARWRAALMVAELSLSMTLLVAAALLVRSFVAVRSVDSGFDAPEVVAMNVNLPDARYATPGARLAFFEDLAGRVSAMPGIESAAYANRMPVRGGWGTGLLVDDGTTLNPTDAQAVSPAYFRTLGIPIVRGRAFAPEDRIGAPPVVIVNAAFARAYLPGVDAVGHRVRRQTRTPTAPLTIVGVVADIHRAGPANPASPQTYFPAAQTDLYPVKLADFAFRAAGDPTARVADVQRAIWAIDPHQPVTRVGLLADIVRTTMAPRAFEATLMTAFSALALALAIVGVYGVVSDAVSRRTREIGLRMALGASRTDIVRLIGATTVLLVGASVAIGAGAAWLLARTLRALLFGVSPTDLSTYAAVAAVLSAVALAASAIPMWRAIAINPTQALRQE
jgi:putative ABC transport system permease protein